MSYASPGPVIVMTAADVDMLWRSAGLEALRVRHRLADDPLYRLLVRMHQVRLSPTGHAANGLEARHLAASEERSYWTIRQLAKATGRAERTIRKDIAIGELTATKPAREWIIAAADAANYITSRRRTP
ncbi:hypothetical protein D8Y23_12790 [Microbacterium enclense]|uniref:Helix-turn-helix domain-containing protein n=1 Tax=Microbacterium enclense TaxID=993073 RepID=A0A3S3LC33_9MICO|nr:hypothetical protein [Microbacterium enclense]RWR16792.1 hypothetical protein D8Y23_12790 [Microbacterium enclense]